MFVIQSNDMDIVNEVLQKAAREAEKFKPITVEKHLEVEFDVGNLFAFDTNELELRKLRLVHCYFSLQHE